MQKEGRHHKGEYRGARCDDTGVGGGGILNPYHIAKLVDAHTAERHDDEVLPILFVNALFRHHGGYEPEQRRCSAQPKSSHAYPVDNAAFHGPFAQRAHQPETQKRRQRNQVRSCMCLPVHAARTIAQYGILCNLYVVVYEACFSRAGAL